jgi:DNA repair protein RadC
MSSSLASVIVVEYNHLSGDPTPSLEDAAVTEQIREGRRCST